MLHKGCSSCSVAKPTKQTGFVLWDAPATRVASYLIFLAVFLAWRNKISAGSLKQLRIALDETNSPQRHRYAHAHVVHPSKCNNITPTPTRAILSQPGNLVPNPLPIRRSHPTPINAPLPIRRRSLIPRIHAISALSTPIRTLRPIRRPIHHPIHRTRATT